MEAFSGRSPSIPASHGYEADTVYIGGGTPTLLDERLPPS
jgi:coproporphyrinogen III oxidase-like Fe-S oxidoreductase